MPRIEREDLIKGFPQLTPEQLILLSWVYETYDRTPAGANTHIANIEYFYSQRAIGGSEFETYAITKMYVAFYSRFSWASAATATAFQIALYSMANAINSYVNPQTIGYTGAALNYAPLSVELRNYFFARIAALAGTAYIIFSGLRITFD